MKAITVEPDAVVAAAEESAVAAAAVTAMGMVGGDDPVFQITPLSLPWTSWR